MTEPNIVRTKRQRIEEGTAGSYFGPLPKRYGRFSHLYFALQCIEIHIYCIAIDLYCIQFDIHHIVIDSYCVEFDTYVNTRLSYPDPPALHLVCMS